MSMYRREFLGALTAPLVVGAVADVWAQEPAAKPAPRKGRLKQGITGGVLRGMPFEDACREAAKLGIEGFDLRGPNDWPTLKKYGLVPSMYTGGPGGTIPIGPSHKDTPAELIPKMHAAIDEAAANGVPNIISLAGERRGQGDAEGAENCVTFFNAVKAHAEDKQVTICLEYLNSKVN